MNKDLLDGAKAVLDANFQEGGFTIPSDGLYPFQWKWDSGFIAIGLAYYDMEKAQLEVTTLLNAQWENGFIPHIVFHNESDTYFPGADFHRSDLHPLSSKRYRSTGMTQPPVLGFVLQEMLRIARNKTEMLDFIRKNIDAVFENHRYFYSYRDPHKEGLMYIYHNWESGTDNSPLWDDIFATMDPPSYNFSRKDTSHVEASQRPTRREYDYYLYLIDIAKEVNYDETKIAERSPFLVQDPLLNAMLIKSNTALIELYKLLGGYEQKIVQLQKWQDLSLKNFNNKLYNKELGAYVHYDLRNNRQLPYLCSSSFAPIFAGIPSEDQAAKMIQLIESRFGGGDKYLCASFDPTHERHDPKRYWRGPVWINMNWMLYYGLKDYGYQDLAERIRADSIELIEKNGFYEYFDCRKEKSLADKAGYGGANFSWSAALIIDLLNTD